MPITIESVVLAVLFAALFHLVRFAVKLARINPHFREAQHRLRYIAFLQGERERMRYQSEPLGYAAALSMELLRAEGRHAAAIERMNELANTAL